MIQDASAEIGANLAPTVTTTMTYDDGPSPTTLRVTEKQSSIVLGVIGGLEEPRYSRKLEAS